ncbi:MAG: CpsD/CapB family tyrosine-protein kinase, partial [Planctomycetaceae bacterium]|nr:CpsD/CapB family tyrosine-protein kinase [Planctomycetaceae bacterium]
LIDGDIRRPSVHKVFDLKNRPGLCEVLTDKVEFTDALHSVSPAGLTVLTAGRVDSDALRVLAQDKMGQLIELARSRFDFIILDTSPILPVTDALLMSQFMDGVLFSLRRDVSRSAKVSAAVQRVAMLGVNILGAVAIGLDEGPSRSRYSYYNYGYGYGYGQNPHSPGSAPAQPPARRS